MLMTYARYRRARGSRSDPTVLLLRTWLEGEDEVSKAKKHGMAAASEPHKAHGHEADNPREMFEICGEVEL